MKALMMVLVLLATGPLTHASENENHVIHAVQVINNQDRGITLIQPYVKLNTSAYIGFEMSCSLWANGCLYSLNDNRNYQSDLADATCAAIGRQEAITYSYSESNAPKATYALIGKGGYLSGIYAKNEDAKKTWKFLSRDYDYRGWEQFYSIYYLKSVTCR